MFPGGGEWDRGSVGHLGDPGGTEGDLSDFGHGSGCPRAAGERRRRFESAIDVIRGQVAFECNRKKDISDRRDSGRMKSTLVLNSGWVFGTAGSLRAHTRRNS